MALRTFLAPLLQVFCFRRPGLDLLDCSRRGLHTYIHGH
jgi:hypothetical protein